MILTFASVILAMMSPSALWAQVYTADPPHQMMTDRNGVDMLTATPTVKSATVSIGPEKGGLSFNRTWRGSQPGWSDMTQTGIDVNPIVLGMPYSSPATVSVGMATDMFPTPFDGVTSCTPLSLQSMLGSGGTLTLSCSPTVWKYTARDGTIYTINPAITSYEEYLCPLPRANPYGSLTSIQKPNGEVITYNYDSSSRVQSITNNRGYQIKFTYYSNTSNATNGLRTIASAVAINNSIDYCNPAATACANFNGAVGPSGTTWPSLTLGGYSGYATNTLCEESSPTSQTDAVGNTTTYSLGLTETTPAGVVTQYNDGHQYVADGNSTLGTEPGGSTVVRNGQTWAYNYNCSQPSILTAGPKYTGNYCSEATVTRTDPIVGSQTSGSTYTISDSLLQCFASCYGPATQQSPDEVVIVSSPFEIFRATDELGRITNYYNDGFGRIDSVTSPLGQQSVFTYDSESSGNASRGDLINITNCPIPTSTPGCLASTQSSSNIVYTSAYPATCTNALTCNEPTSKTDANSNTTTYTYSSVHGGVLTETKPAGANGIQPVTAYNYSQIPTYAITTAGGPLVQVGLIWEVTGTYTCATSAATVTATTTGATLSCAAGASDEIVKTTSYTGSNNALPMSVTTASGDGKLSRTETYTYDNIGNLISVTKPMGSANTPTTTVYIYDADRRKIGEIGPAPTGDGHYRATRTTYDGDGRVTLTETGYTTSQSATALSTFVSLEQAATVYDASGRKIQDTHSGGGVTSTLTQYSYDALDRLVCTAVRMNQSAFASLMATYSSTNYTASGVLPTAACSLGPQGSDGPDRITYRTYDAAGQLLSTVSGYGTSVQRTDHTSTYTLDGKEATAADGNGNLTTFVYDSFDRLSQTFYPNPAGGSVSSTTDYEQYGYDSDSNMLTDRRRDGNTLSMAYDGLNREISKSGSGIPTVFTSYDLLGRKTSITYNSATGPGNAYAYDALGRVTSASTYSWPITFQYDLAGDRTAITWWDGVAATYSYDNDGELTSIAPSAPNAPVSVLASYAYDDLGRRVSASLGNGVSTAYGYDGISRLTSLTHTMVGGNIQSQTYGLGYTASSQINALTTTNGAYQFPAFNANLTYGVNGQNQLTTSGGAAIAYDARGNLNNDSVNTYTYDLLNRLVSTGAGVTTVYDPEDRLLSITQGGTTTQFAYVGANVATEFNGATNQILRRYVPGASEDEPVVWFEGSDGSSPRWLLQDHQGSVVAVTDMSGGTLALNSYGDYGAPASGNLGRYQFTGQFYLPEVGVYDYKARLYSPTQARFMQTDPVGYADGLNWYDYVHNDPVNGTDPSGLALTVNGDCAAGDHCTSTNPDKSNAEQAARNPGSQAPATTSKYQRPPDATNPALRKSVQGQPRAKCGGTSSPMYAGHVIDLVVEWYETGHIDLDRMRSPDAVRPECKTCSNKGGGVLSQYSRQMWANIQKGFDDQVRQAEAQARIDSGLPPVEGGARWRDQEAPEPRMESPPPPIE